MRKLLALLLVFTALPASAQENTPLAKAQLLLHAPQVNASNTITAGVLFTITPGWHIYWQNPGDSGIPTTLDWTVPEGMSVSEILWPLPERIETSGLVNYGYSERVILPVILTPANDGIAGEVKVKAQWLVCKDICIPESAELTATLPSANPQAQVLLTNNTGTAPQASDVAAHFMADEKQVILSVPVAALELSDDTIATAQWLPIDDGIIRNSAVQDFTVDNGVLTITTERGSAELPKEWKGVLRLQSNEEEPPVAFTLTAVASDNAAMPVIADDAAGISLLVAIMFAFLGGIILNAMPCVLPILSLKALAVAKKSGAELHHVRAQGIAYTLGVVASFLAIAGIMLSLKSAGASIGWGFQLQEPAVIAGLFFLMVLVALNLFGLFELPVLFGNRSHDQHSLRGSFLTGALAVMLATPCTAPFMAPAIGATLGLSAAAALLVFAALGLGMASPFLLISLWPAARKFLPKPGAWMLRFKQFLGFPMLATAAWLLWVLTQTTGNVGLLMALTAALLVAWLVWWAHGTTNVVLRRVLLLLVALLIGWSIAMQPKPHGTTLEEDVEPYSAQRLTELRQEGRPVFVDATADWCLTCKINERIALKNEGIKQLFDEKNVALLVADWTSRDAAITQYLATFERNGVPLYVYYPPTGEPVVLPQILTPGIVRAAVQGNESSTNEE